MGKRLALAVVAGAVLLAGAAATRWSGPGYGAVAQAPQAARPVSVETAISVKKPMPVLLEGIGNVTMMANVAVRSRLDNEIVGIHFADGAKVAKGDLLVTLDTRSLEAQIRQAEGTVAKDLAQIEGASATCGATPSWSRRMQRPSSIWRTPRPRSRRFAAR